MAVRGRDNINLVNTESLYGMVLELQQQMQLLSANPPLAFHVHNGYDMNPVAFADIDSKKVYLHHTIPGTSAATSGNYNTIFICPTPMTVTGLREVHSTAGTDGGSVTLQLEKLTGTTSPGGGSSVLASALSLKATANTVQNGSLTTTLANRSLAIGDRLALRSSGTLTSVANVSVLVELTF